MTETKPSARYHRADKINGEEFDDWFEQQLVEYNYVVLKQSYNPPLKEVKK